MSNEIENNVISDLSWLIETNFSLDLNVYYQILFDYVYQNKKFCKMLFSNHVDPSFSDRLLALFKDACLKSWQTLLNKEAASEDLDYLLHYHLQGCFSVIRKWADTDFSYSKEKITRIISKIDKAIAE